MKTVVDCPHGERCGACSGLGRDYTSQLAEKRQALQSALTSFDSLRGVSVSPCLPSPQISGYRNRAKMAVGISKRSPTKLGYFGTGSREIEDAPDCRVLQPDLLRTTSELREFLRGGAHIPRELRHIDLRCGSDSRRQLLTLVLRTKELPQLPIDALRKACRRVDGISVNLNPSSGPTVIRGPIRSLWGAREVYVDLGDLSLRVSANSFFQVNLALLPTIHRLMADFLGEGDSLLDLYSGVGTHGMALASHFRRVTSIEGVRSSVADAKSTIQRFGLRHIRVVPKPVERSLRAIRDAAADRVILNPSRAGAAESVLQTLVASEARKLVYLSCEPRTLSRDLDVLARGGFELESAQPIDMMPLTRQVEAIALLSR